jgi:hypothetical protein
MWRGPDTVVWEFLRTRWQIATGEAETPLDGDSPAWVVSLLVHLLALLLISWLSIRTPAPPAIRLTSPAIVEEDLPQQFHATPWTTPAIGASSALSDDMALPQAPEETAVAVVLDDPPLELLPEGQILLSDEMALAAAPLEAVSQAVPGVAGVGETGASGAVDRITHEIMLSLEQRDTLVVWMFDRSGSLQQQRREIQQRFRRIYDELGLIRTSRHQGGQVCHPLLSAIAAFGQDVSWPVAAPTDDVPLLEQALESIELDRSGIEYPFTAIYEAARRFGHLRSGPQKRNVMLIAVTDEVGDDQATTLEKAVRICRRHAIPVYVLGVPAPFGEVESQVKWIDPDPEFDQTPQWGRVNQGPESLRLELVRLAGTNAASEPMDSGFGPFALTRLCVETGGIYFAIHPNRRTDRRISARQTAAYSAHLARFFDEVVMRRYQPEYVSLREYDQRVAASPVRTAVIQAAQMQLSRMEDPVLRFVRESEAQFEAALEGAQKPAAKLEERLQRLVQLLQSGEKHRDEELAPRWQAAYDLAMGQALAVWVRTRTYNEMLAVAKRGLQAADPQTNTWTLMPADEVSVGSRLRKTAEQARSYLRRVASQHEGTPWAWIAQQELAVPVSWRWTESYTPTAEERRQAAGNNDRPAPPADEQPRMLPKRPPRRPPPRL